MILTLQEIYDLARFAGLPLTEADEPSDDEAEHTFQIGECPPNGLFDETTGKFVKYNKIAWLEEYPEEGNVGLGPQLP